MYIFCRIHDAYDAECDVLPQDRIIIVNCDNNIFYETRKLAEQHNIKVYILFHKNYDIVNCNANSS